MGMPGGVPLRGPVGVPVRRAIFGSVFPQVEARLGVPGQAQTQCSAGGEAIGWLGGCVALSHCVADYVVW